MRVTSTIFVVCLLLVLTSAGKLDRATFGGGDFLRLRKVFSQVPGVRTVHIGYTGGWKPKPNYTEVCMGKTGHSEAVQVVYDTDNVTYNQLLDVFFKSHDPFSKDSQGELVGTQYRSAIYTNDKLQERAATAGKKSVAQNSSLPIQTEITALDQFWTELEHPGTLRSIREEAANMLKSKMAEIEKKVLAAAAASNAPVETTAGIAIPMKPHSNVTTDEDGKTKKKKKHHDELYNHPDDIGHYRHHSSSDAPTNATTAPSQGDAAPSTAATTKKKRANIPII
eukprot:PhF_6_TR39027/c0_g1_i2/m.58412/K07304/msrA; peptide-methionine (S)-S-oxide reductase